MCWRRWGGWRGGGRGGFCIRVCGDGFIVYDGDGSVGVQLSPAKSGWLSLLDFVVRVWLARIDAIPELQRRCIPSRRLAL